MHCIFLIDERFRRDLILANFIMDRLQQLESPVEEFRKSTSEKYGRLHHQLLSALHELDVSMSALPAAYDNLKQRAKKAVC